MYSHDSDLRLSSLRDWLQNGLSMEIQSLEPASSDASFRRYFRVVHRLGTHVVMDAPPEKENTAAFIRVNQLFGEADLPVPQIYRKNIEQGFLLLEDFGSDSLLDKLNSGNADRFYGTAMDSLFTLQTRVDAVHCGLPAYDTALLERELGIFLEWFLQKLLGIAFPASSKTGLHKILIESALQQPQVCVHRDYHSRNLMVLENDALGIIDFQDAVIGPISYDPVSLLRDCYIRWPEAEIERWAQAYYQRLAEAKLLHVDYPQFKRWFDLMGLQRHLKAVGIFSRLHLRDGKSSYLADIPRTLGYVVDVAENYPELSELKTFLQQQVLPVYQAKL